LVISPDLCSGKVIIESGALISGRGEGLPSCIFKSPPKPKLKKKNTHTSVATSILNVLCDLPFRQNQPQNSADDCYIRILKTVLIKLENRKEGHCD
jgi:hypothetical protein